MGYCSSEKSCEDQDCWGWNFLVVFMKIRQLQLNLYNQIYWSGLCCVCVGGGGGRGDRGASLFFCFFLTPHLYLYIFRAVGKWFQWMCERKLALGSGGPKESVSHPSSTFGIFPKSKPPGVRAKSPLSRAARRVEDFRELQPRTSSHCPMVKWYIQAVHPVHWVAAFLLHHNT